MNKEETGRAGEARLNELVRQCLESASMDLNLYLEYDVKRGLRESGGKGVLTGLTEISDVTGFAVKGGKKYPIDGELYYQGYNVKDIISGREGRRFGFEEVTYLLLFGKLPTKKQLDDFIELLADYRELPSNFVRDVIMKAPSANIMNGMQKSVLTLFSYDDDPDSTDILNVLRQSMILISSRWA